MVKIFYVFVFSLILFSGYGQSTSINLTIQPSINSEKIELNIPYLLSDSSQLEITTCRLYLSNFIFYYKGKEVAKNESAFLLDLENPESLTHAFPNVKFDQLVFNLGIDSSTNVAGILDGDLDPIKGMYWTWNSGYINFKLEGNYTQHLLKSMPFEFHIGGYLPPYQTIKTISLLFPSASETSIINLDLSDFISTVDFQGNKNVMIPGPQAVKLANSLSTCFKLQ